MRRREIQKPDPAQTPGTVMPICTPTDPDRKPIKYVKESVILKKKEEEEKGGSRKAPEKPPEFIIPTHAAQKEKPRLPYYVGNCAILGPTGAGKSVIIANILNNAPASEVYLFVPTSSFDEDYAYDDILQKRKITYYQKDLEQFNEVLEHLQKKGTESRVNKLTFAGDSSKKKDKEKPLLIFDDIGNNLQSPDFADFIKYARKVTSGIIIAIQAYNQLKPDVWKQMKRIVLFTNLSQDEISLVLDRISLSVPRKDIEALIEKNKGKYQFITIDLIRDEVYLRFG